MKSKLKNLIPVRLFPFVKKCYLYLLYHVFDRRSSSSMIPYDIDVSVGEGDHLAVGEEFKNYMVALGGLKPNDRVLDVGCGNGRMAIPLTKYLSSQGEYQGFDIVKSGITWCQQRITPRFANFTFSHSDVYSKHYNAAGKEQASTYVFPFEDNYFDFVFLTSVFTHMLPGDLENYMKEISRVLKPGGRSMITYFLLNDESRELIEDDRCSLDFAFEQDGYLSTSENDPEAAIAFDEEYIKQAYLDSGMKLSQRIHYGRWCDRPRHLGYQDLIISHKVA